MPDSELYDKSFLCDVCEQKFDTDDDLQRHYLVHISEHYEKHAILENHACHICENPFSCEKDLQDHLTNTKCQFRSEAENQVDLSETSCQEDDSMPTSITKVDDSEEVLVITPENCNITNVYIFTDDSESTIDQNSLQGIDLDTLEQARCTEITVYVIPPGSSFQSDTLEMDLNKENTQTNLNENDDNLSCSSLTSDIIHSPDFSSAFEKQITDEETRPSFHNKHQSNSSLHGGPYFRRSGRSVRKTFKCIDCGKCYNHRLSLKSHQRNNHGSKKPYECFICEKAFALRKNLRKHVYTHSEDKPYKCMSCFKGFIRKDEFEIHMMIHRGETPPSKCIHCGKVCFSMSNLRNHILHHHKNPDTYRHNCSVCEKKFAANYILQRHMKIHTNPTNEVL